MPDSLYPSSASQLDACHRHPGNDCGSRRAHPSHCASLRSQRDNIHNLLRLALWVHRQPASLHRPRSGDRLHWFVPQESIKIEKKSFLWTIGLLFPVGAGLDFFFARFFFVFPNEGATLGIKAPALGAPVPIEEYAFYLAGFLCVLLLYIWLDQYWLAAYNVETEIQPTKAVPPPSPSFTRNPSFSTVILIGSAILYKEVPLTLLTGSFPGYFIFLALTALVPSSALLPSTRPVINWRAFSLAVFFVLLVSLMWEATLAIPYGWWNYRDEQMLGVRITGWGELPIEAVFLWMAVTYSTVIVYETVKCWREPPAKSVRRALFGEPVRPATNATSTSYPPSYKASPERTVHTLRLPRHTNLPPMMNQFMRKCDPTELCGMIFIKSRSTFSGVVSFVNSSRRDNRITCVSTTTPTAIPYQDPNTTFPVFLATPGSVKISSIVSGTFPLKLLRHHPGRPLNRLRLVPKKSSRPNQLLKLRQGLRSHRLQVKAP